MRFMSSLRNASCMTRSLRYATSRVLPVAQIACEHVHPQAFQRQQNRVNQYRFFSTRNESSTKRFLSDLSPPHLELPTTTTNPPIPAYLQDEYWWAYVHPSCISTLDHQFLVNIVLWGNFEMLRDVALDELGKEMIQGQTLQVSCVYANFTECLAERMAPDATLNVVDVVPAQLQNLERKLDNHNKGVTLSCNDAQSLQFNDDSFDQVVLFFLLHEMPNNVRKNALKEATRVLKRGGKMVMVDYHRPDTARWRSVMTAMYHLYEPFAADMWQHDIQEWLPDNAIQVSKQVYFGGLYQKVVVTKK